MRSFFFSVDNAFDTEYPPKEDTTNILSEYLSELTFSEEDDFGLLFPKRDIPSGFRLSYKRCSKRAQYGFTSEFSIILSKESSYRNDITTETKVSSFRIIKCKKMMKKKFSIGIDHTFFVLKWDARSVLRIRLQVLYQYCSRSAFLQKTLPHKLGQQPKKKRPLANEPPPCTIMVDIT